jgi:peptidyl-dipeptidase Dcp
MPPIVTEFTSSVVLNSSLYETLKATAVRLSHLDPAQRRLVDERLLDFVMQGADPSVSGKATMERLNSAISSDSRKYTEKVLGSTSAFEIFIDNEECLAGIPQAAKDSAKAAATAKGEVDKWRFGLDWPSRSAILLYADNGTLRKTICEPGWSIGSGSVSTEELIWDLLKLRTEKAKLLGFDNFLDYVLKRRMARAGQAVLDFIARCTVECIPSSTKRTRSSGSSFQRKPRHPSLKSFLGTKATGARDGNESFASSTRKIFTNSSPPVMF